MHALLDIAPAVLIAWMAVPPLARYAPALGLMALPSERAMHDRPVPRIGGIAIFLGMAGALALLAVRAHPALEAGAAWLPYLVPAALYFAIGLADDGGRLPTGPKFLLQAAAAACAVALGLRWDGAALGPFAGLDFGAGAPLMTWLWIVAVVTLVNFVDGIDLITAATAVVVLGAAAGGGTGPGAGLLYILAAAAVAGFGFWNLRPARAFPGDSATHLLGFLIASVALEEPGTTRGLPWAVASAPLLPGVLDVALGLVAKARRGVPLARAHNQHLHQRLTRVGWSHAAVALRYGLLALVALWLVAWVAPHWGLGICLGLGAVVLLAHLGQGLGRTRGIAYRLPGR